MKIKLAPMIGVDGFCEWLRERGYDAEVQKHEGAKLLTRQALYHQAGEFDREASSKFISHLLVQYHEDPFRNTI